MTNSVMRTIGYVQRSVPKVRVIYSLIIALIPILADYAGLFGLGLGTWLLGLFIPYALLYVGNDTDSKVVVPIVVMLGYYSLRFQGHVASLLLHLAAMINLVAIAKGAANLKLVRKCIEIVAVVSTFLILIQYLGYYLFDVKINYLIAELLQEEFRAKVAGVDGSLYRPSAFFLEPAHYTQFCSVALISVLFPGKEKKPRIIKIAWIVLGCVLSTSGMGIMLVVAALAWFALFYKNDNGKRPVPLSIWIALGLLAFGVMLLIPFFRMTILRIVGRVDGYNALLGRLGSWEDTIAQMQGLSVLFGYGSGAEYEWYITGLMKIIYRYGWLGLALMLIVLIRHIRIAKDYLASYVALAYFGLLVIADVSTVYSMIYYIGICAMVCFKQIEVKRKLNVRRSVERLTGLSLQEDMDWLTFFRTWFKYILAVLKKPVDREWWRVQWKKVTAFTKRTVGNLEWWKSVWTGFGEWMGGVLTAGKSPAQWKQLFLEEMADAKSFIQTYANKELWSRRITAVTARLKGEEKQ